MLIDAHTHLGRPGGAIDSRATDLIASMDKAGIDKALVFAGRMNSITTQQVIDEIDPYKGRLYAVGSVSETDSQSYEQMVDILDKMEERLKFGTIRALKFYPGYEHYYPAAEWVRPYLKLLVKYDRPAIFHSGDTFSKVGEAKLKYALPIHIDDLATDLPELKIIIAHLGYPWQREAAEVVYKNKNVYTDCSGFVYGDFTQKLDTDYRHVWNEFIQIAGGSDKILFGTDWPISNQGSYVRQVVNLVESTRDPQVGSEVLSGNAIKLFGL